MKPYNHLIGYLHRWCIVKLGRFMLRLHKILDCDRTPFLHTHPFWYISIVLCGGYIEQVLVDGVLKSIMHGPGSIIIRRPGTAHRIQSVQPNCMTLFFTWAVSTPWKLIRHPELRPPLGYHDAPDGTYMFADGFRKRSRGMWYALRETPLDAEFSNTLSIHQNIKV